MEALAIASTLALELRLNLVNPIKQRLREETQKLGIFPNQMHKELN